MDIKDKVVVITGSTSGLGRALAEAFTKANARVVVSGRDDAHVQSVAAEIGAFGIVADVTSEDAVAQLAEKTGEKFGRIDFWINNAGVWMPHGPVEGLDMKKAHEVMEVNVFGVMYGSRAALTIMKKQGFGVIINILSSSGLAAKLDDAAYCASKFGATGFTKSLQLEVVGSPINVIGVYPTRMQTDLFDAQKPADITTYMLPSFVAGLIIENVLKEDPEKNLIIGRAI